MTKYLDISTDTTNQNSITVVNQEPYHVVMAKRDDINTVLNLFEAKCPGVYFLFGQNDDNTQKLYIGQSATTVASRLYQHNKNKDFWHTVIFFGQEHLSKAKTDYLERMLIDTFGAYSDDPNQKEDKENATAGNQSYISHVEKRQADALWNFANDVITNVLNRDYFDTPDHTSTNLFNKPNINGFKITVKQAGVEVASANQVSLRGTVVDVFTQLLEKNLLTDVMTQGAPTSSAKTILGTQPAYSPKHLPLTTKIGDHYLYVNFSRPGLEKMLNNVASLTKLDINLETIE